MRCMPTATFFPILFAGITCLGGIGSQVFAQADLESVQERLKADLTFLASDEQEGRDSGSPGIRRAAEFIKDRFDSLGVKTDSFDGQPFQNFSLPGPATLGPIEQNQLTFEGVENNFALGDDYNPLALGSNGKFAGEVVFAGYGITAPEWDYDDYADVDVEGKIVIVLRKEPQQDDEASPFNGKENSQYAFFSAKEMNAAMHKVGALIMVNDLKTVSSGVDQILGITAGGASVSNSQVPTFYCTRALVDAVLAKGMGKTLAELEAEIDSDLKPRSQVLADVKASGEVLIQDSRLAVRNVIGFYPGAGELAEEYVVVGAHYDHVGMGGQGSLAPGTIAIHNGADDNGSGTATMLEVARRLTEMPYENRRSFIFMAFTAEERGLLGSKHYVRNPRWALEDTVAMINMDMVGRLNQEDVLTVYGTGTAEEFDGMIDRLNETAKFNLVKDPAGYGPSDHQSFYEAKIPVFHFFTGLHNNYHRPSDDVELVNFEGMARIADMVTKAAIELATNAERPTYLATNARADVRASTRRRRAVIGISLDQGRTEPVVAAVTVGGPADKAGLITGDVIVKIGDDDTATVADLRRTMRRKKPSDKVELLIQRGSETITVELTLDSQ